MAQRIILSCDRVRPAAGERCRGWQTFPVAYYEIRDAALAAGWSFPEPGPATDWEDVHWCPSCTRVTAGAAS